MSLHREIAFENEICAALAAAGWLCEEGDHARYDRARALYPADLAHWVRSTQPGAWQALVKSYGERAESALADRVRESIDKVGTLDALRHGIDVLGLRGRLMLAQFRPALALNPEITGRYEANRLRVVRQLRYAEASEHSIDLVLFLNGVPIATSELKTDFTQSIEDAIAQYKRDRNPRPSGGRAEPLLSFPGGALVHFAVSGSEVWMTTKLAGPATTFLPFNRGNQGGKGNPPHPSGHKTAYLWEEIWQRDSLLEILGRYMVAQRNKKKQIERVIFPRYHQLDATRKLQEAVLRDGPGKRYLIQHSAGSGKTNSIAWSAHFLADLHDERHRKVFDSVLVVSDRTVIDTQLQEAIFGFERTTGVVATIKGEGGSKSAELAEALSGDKKIVVCTIQTFPYALGKVRELAATQGKRFAVIADEAHSSQSGEAASKLKDVLTQKELDELADGGEVTIDDILASQMAGRVDDQGITFVAFTATPKAKTMELFGTRPDPTRPLSPENIPAPFHVYSMRQAIEEGFILDVLDNYTTYKLAFKLAHEGKDIDDREVERSAALKKIMSWVKLHPYNIAQKVEIVVEHYRTNVAPLLEGTAKAMVVVSSRQEAVRWKLAIDKYIAERGYLIGTLVAFSGEVRDPDSGPDPFTETGSSMNPTLRGRNIRDAFDTDEFQVLLVANKFQTGFDQPLLCGMYVDKRLAGIQAVQTLSRLNRMHPGKDVTFILDFVNSADEVLEAFKMYHDTARLSSTSDPNLVLDLRAKLDAAGHYDTFEVERVVSVVMDPRATQGALAKALEPAADRLMKKFQEARLAQKAAEESGDTTRADEAKQECDALLLFRSDMGAYVRIYTFLSQIFDYANTDYEKRAIFYKHLIPLLEFGREREGIDLSKVVMTHHSLRDEGKRRMGLSEGERPFLEPLGDTGSGEIQEKQKALLLEILRKVNELFEGELTDHDKLVYVNNVIMGKLLESEVLREQAASNSKQQFANSPDLHRELLNAIIGALEAHTTMSSQALGSTRIQDGIKDILLGPARLYEALREQRIDK